MIQGHENESKVNSVYWTFDACFPEPPAYCGNKKPRGLYRIWNVLSGTVRIICTDNWLASQRPTLVERGSWAYDRTRIPEIQPFEDPWSKTIRGSLSYEDPSEAQSGLNVSGVFFSHDVAVNSRQRSILYPQLVCLRRLTQVRKVQTIVFDSYQTSMRNCFYTRLFVLYW